MLFLAIVLLLTSLAIAGVSAYFSIVGLSLLFVGSGISIIIMGSALEVGKLVAVTTLHHLWNKLNFMLKTYLFLAAIVLSVITSIGIYGFLANGYNTTSIKVKSLTESISLNENKIKFLTAENLKLENIKPEPSIVSADVKEDTQLKYFDQQASLIQQRENKIQDLRKSIDTLRLKAQEEKQQAKVLLDGEITKEISQVNLYNNRLQILDREVQTWLDQGTGGLFRQNGLERARQVKESQQKERDVVENQIKNSQSNIEKLRKEYSVSVSNIDLNLSNQIKSIETNIEKLETEINTIRVEISNSKKLNDESEKNKTETKREEKNKFENVLKQNRDTININNKEIENLIESNKQLSLKITETDVGTFKFFAKNFNLELDKTVNWFIIMIIAVFDPLAVTLLLCFNYIISLNRKKEEKLTAPPPSASITTTPEPTKPVPTPIIEDKKELLFDDGKDEQQISSSEFNYIHVNDLGKLEYRSYPQV